MGRRKALGGQVARGFFEGLAAARHLPVARPDRHDVEVIRDLRYGDGPRQLLDVYRPRERRGPTPTVVYVHGGGFRILSKETHFLFGLAWARRGYTVFNVDYRLAPRHPYPAAHEDAAQALIWVLDHARRFHADPDRLLLAGESAGANIVTSLTIATHFERDEPFARAVHERAPEIRGVAPACGILQVSDPARFWRNQPMSRFMRERIEEVSTSYLPGAPAPLADPLLILEGDTEPVRPLPPFFAPVGTADPIEEDTLRLGRALEQRGVDVTTKRYDKGMHAFHAFVWRSEARRCWREMLAFSDRVTAA